MDNCARRFLESTQFVVSSRHGWAGQPGRTDRQCQGGIPRQGLGLLSFLDRWRLLQAPNHTQYVCAAPPAVPAGQVLPVESRRRRRPAQRLLRRRLPPFLAWMPVLVFVFLVSPCLSCASR